MSDAEFTLICIFIALGFFGALGFGGSFFLAIFCGLVGLLFGAHVVGAHRRASKK